MQVGRQEQERGAKLEPSLEPASGNNSVSESLDERVAQLQSLCQNLTADSAAEQRRVLALEEDKKVLIMEVKRLARKVLGVKSKVKAKASSKSSLKSDASSLVRNSNNT